MAGYQVGDACYPTQIAAGQATASQYTGVLLVAGSGSYAADVVEVTASTIRYRFYPVDGSASFTKTVPFTAQPCNLLGTDDAVELGWLVIGTWVAAYSVRFLTRVVRDHMGETTNGDA